jgi:antitoxin (DNA-binding transcriptional repressor) of toxin-antitoxin stability system
VPVVGLRQLSRETRDVIEQLGRDGETTIITRQGRPVAALSPVSEQQAAAFGLAFAPEFVASRERAAKAIADGEGRPASELLAELEPEDDAEEPFTAATVQSFLPPSLIQRVVRAAIGGIPGSASAAPIVSLNAELTNTLMEDVVVSVIERVRAVNESIVAQAGEDAEAISVETYTDQLQHVMAAERLLSRRRATSVTPLSTSLKD